jgi:cell division protein FtsN
MPRLTTRDFKRPPQPASSAGRLTGFALGVICGAALASGGFLLQRAHARHGAAQGAAATHADLPSASTAHAPAASASAQTQAAAARTSAPEQFDFYRMLPRFKVTVPRKPTTVAPLAPPAPSGADRPANATARPTSYVLQVGSYRKRTEAQQVRDRLARAGIDARVERVLAAGDLWYRVRVGPISDPAELERVRGELRAAHMSALEIPLHPH